MGCCHEDDADSLIGNGLSGASLVNSPVQDLIFRGQLQILSR